MTELIAAIDQGTTSTRCMLFDHSGRAVAAHQLEHRQHYPQPGWVEHDPVEIWQCTRQAVRYTLAKAPSARIIAVGIAITINRYCAFNMFINNTNNDTNNNVWLVYT